MLGFESVIYFVMALNVPMSESMSVAIGVCRWSNECLSAPVSFFLPLLLGTYVSLSMILLRLTLVSSVRVHVNRL